MQIVADTVEAVRALFTPSAGRAVELAERKRAEIEDLHRQLAEAEEAGDREMELALNGDELAAAKRDAARADARRIEGEIAERHRELRRIEAKGADARLREQQAIAAGEADQCAALGEHLVEVADRLDRLIVEAAEARQGLAETWARMEVLAQRVPDARRLFAEAALNGRVRLALGWGGEFGRPGLLPDERFDRSGPPPSVADLAREAGACLVADLRARI